MTNKINRYDYLHFSKETSDSFCTLPFAQLFFSSTGRVAPCCLIQDYYIGDIQTRSIQEIWNGPEMKALRKEFLTGNIRTCKIHQKHKQCHRVFERLLPFVKIEEESSISPIRLELRINSHCNLACQMCQNKHESSSIYTSSSPFPEQLRNELLPYAQEITILGGEPFIQQNTFEILELAARINPHCLWGFVSNLNVDIDKVILALAKLRISRFQVSIDSLNESTYIKIRKGGSHKLMMSNLDKLIAFRETYQRMTGENFRFQAAMCIQRDNWREIPAFLDFCEQKRLNANLQFAYHPTSVTLSVLEREEKDKIIDYLLDHCEGDRAIYLKPILAALADDASALEWKE